MVKVQDLPPYKAVKYRNRYNYGKTRKLYSLKVLYLCGIQGKERLM